MIKFLVVLTIVLGSSRLRAQLPNHADADQASYIVLVRHETLSPTMHSAVSCYPPTITCGNVYVQEDRWLPFPSLADALSYINGLTSDEQFVRLFSLYHIALKKTETTLLVTRPSDRVIKTFYEVAK